MRYILTHVLLVLLCGSISNGSDAVGTSLHGAVPGDGQGERDGGRHSICIKKDIIDDETGKVMKSYDLQLDFDRDINEIVRQANNRANLGKRVKCHIKLKHSELSNVLDTTRDVPCTMTCEREVGLGYPLGLESLDETWGTSNIRWPLGVLGRFDLTFVLVICRFDSKEDAKRVLVDNREYAAKNYTTFQVSDDMCCMLSVQADHYVSICISIVTYKDKQE